MRCPLCGHNDTQVKDSRPREGKSWQDAGSDFIRNGVFPAAPVHAPPDVRSPLPREQGAANTPTKAQGEISVRFDNAPAGTRISAHASGTAFKLDAGSGANFPIGQTGSAPSNLSFMENVSTPSAEPAGPNAAAPVADPSAAPPPAPPPAEGGKAHAKPAVPSEADDLAYLKAHNFKNIPTEQDFQKELESEGGRNIVTQMVNGHVAVMEDENGKPIRRTGTAEPDLSKAHPEPLDMKSFYRAMRHVTENNPGAHNVVQQFFDNRVPIIPQDPKQKPNPDPSKNYHSTYYQMGQVKDEQGNVVNSGLDAIFWNPAAAPEVSKIDESDLEKHISPSLALLHEIDHSIAYRISNLGAWNLSHTKALHNYENLEEKRVISGVDITTPEGLEEVKKMLNDKSPEAVEGALKILRDEDANKLENKTADILGEPKRVNHHAPYGHEFVMVNDPNQS